MAGMGRCFYSGSSAFCGRWLVGPPHRCDGLPTFYLKKPDQNVGAGLLANAVCQLIHVRLTHRIREQARSHAYRIATPPSFVRSITTYPAISKQANYLFDIRCLGSNIATYIRCLGS